MSRTDTLAPLQPGALAPHPPRYRGHPLLGAMPELVRDPLAALLRMSAQGDVVGFRLLGARHYLAASPDAVEQVLLSSGKKYRKLTRTYDILSLSLGRGLVTSEGEPWRKQRRTIQPAFHRQRIAGFSRTMTDVASETLERWRRLPQGPLDLHAEMMRLTLHVVCRTLLSIDVSAKVEEVGRALDTANEHLNRRAWNPLLPPEWVPTPANLRFRRANRVLEGVVRGAIAERRQAGASARGDLLDLLMAVRDEETGEGMPDQQLRDEVLTMFAAGHETTASALSWTFFLLARHPDVEAAVRAELREQLGGRVPTLEDLPRLTLLDRVIKESMRLYPPVWGVDRAVTEPDTLGGFQVRPGDVALVSPWVTHRLPSLWPSPERFDPDRFLPEAEARRHRCAYLPFIQGTRKCIGDMFAMTELRLVLATLLPAIRFSLEASRPPTPAPLVTLRPRSGMWMNLHLQPVA